MDKNLSKRVEEKEKRGLRAERMQASAYGVSGDLKTDDSVISLQVASALASDLQTWRPGMETPRLQSWTVESPGRISPGLRPGDLEARNGD